MARKKFKPTEKMFDPLLTKVRDAAYGKDMNIHIYQTTERSARMRDDEALLRAAQEKRARKLERARTLAKRTS